jgi:putative protein-disulfide isomerase
MALTAAALTGPDHELDALEAIPAARYIEGRDVTALAVLVDIFGSTTTDWLSMRFRVITTARNERQ